VKTTTLLLFFVILMSFASHAQGAGEEINPRVVNGEVKAIVFKELWTGKIVKEIDIASLNPYSKRKWGKFVAKDGTQYHVANTRVETHVSDSAKYFIAVAFAYYPISADNITIVDKIESAVFVFDRKGEEILRLEALPYPVQKPLISKDGKYLGLYFGELLYEARNIYVGFQIFNVKSKALLYNETAGNIFGQMRSGMMIFSEEKDRKLWQVYIFNPKNRKLYTRLFSVVEFGFLSRYTDNGAVLRFASGLEVELPFEGAFDEVEML
jgi:hypothetical protein